MTDAPKPPRPARKQRRRQHNRKRQSAQTGSEQNKTAQKQPHGQSRRKSSPNKARRAKSLTPTRILQKYDNLMEQYLTARKKFFDLYGRANQKQFSKVEKNYQSALENLRKLEADLKEDWQKDVLATKIDGLPQDRQFSTEHNLNQTGDVVSFVGEFEDPHLLHTQKEHQWSEDTDESQGTMDDYYAYKGINPVTK